MITNNRKDIVDLDRHLNCHHYGCALRCPLRSYHLKKGEELTIDSEKHFMFVFVEARSSSYSYRDETERHACRGDFFLFLGTQRTVTIYGEGKDTTVHTFFFSKPTQLCDNYAISQLKDKAPTSSHVFISLPTHESIKMVLDSILYMHDHQLNCINIYESKLKELFFYLGAFYEREQVAWILAPLLVRRSTSRSLWSKTSSAPRRSRIWLIREGCRCGSSRRSSKSPSICPLTPGCSRRRRSTSTCSSQTPQYPSRRSSRSLASPHPATSPYSAAVSTT